MMLQVDAVVRLENYANQVKTARLVPNFVFGHIQRGSLYDALPLGPVKGIHGAKATARRSAAAFNLYKYQAFAVAGNYIQLQPPLAPVARHNAEAIFFKKGGGAVFPFASGNEVGGL